MHDYRLIEPTRPTLWHVVPPLFGLALLALLILIAPALWSWWGLLGAALICGVALYFLSMARTVAELSPDGEG